MTIPRAPILALLAGALVLGGCSNLFPERLRYRMTVEVDTPEGLRTGSTVRELINRGNTPYLPGGDSDVVEEEGEALAVDLPGGTLFVSLVGSTWCWGQSLRYGTVTPRIDVSAAERWPRSMRTLMRAFRRANATSSIRPEQLGSPENQLPRMFRFGNLRDPQTMEPVDVANLAASFGAGTRLKRIVFEVTDEPVSNVIERRLPWLKDPARFAKIRGNIHSNKVHSDLAGFKSNLKR